MADEENKVAADSAAAEKTTKSVKKKTVKKAAKKSVKKKSVKKSVKKPVKKAVKKKSTKSATTEKTETAVTASANGNGQKEKAKIRLKTTQTSTVVRAPVQKKDSLATLSKISIALLFIIGIWAFVSYLDDEEGAEVKIEPATATAPVAMPEAVAPVVMPEQMPMNMAPAETAPVPEVKVDVVEEVVVEKTEAADKIESEEKAEETKGFFEGIFGSKDETTDGDKDAATGDVAASQPAVDQAPMPQPYGQPAPWGPPQDFGPPTYGAPFDPAMQPMPWGPPQGYGPPEDFGPPPGFYDDMPPMPEFNQRPGW